MQDSASSALMRVALPRADHSATGHGGPTGAAASSLGRELPKDDAVRRTRVAATRIVVGYVLLWGLEGALRKWVPGANLGLYVARDALLVAVAAWFYITERPRRRTWWWGVLWAAVVGLTVHAGVAILIAGGSPLAVVLGLRAYLAPVLLAAFASTYGDASTLRAMLTALSSLVLANVPVVALQVTSAPTAAVNRLADGEAGAFVNAGAIARASGTFTAPTGLSLLVMLGAIGALGALIAHLGSRWLHLTALGGVVVIALVSGSRGSLLSLGIVIAVFAYVQLRRASYRAFATLVGMAGFLGLMLVIGTRLFPAAIEAFTTRVEDASEAEDTGGRLLSLVTGFLDEPVPLVGAGTGSHSSAGSLVAGSDWVENEKLRYLAELGVFGYLLGIATVVGAAVCLILVLLRAHRMHPVRVFALAGLGTTLAIGSPTQQPSSQGAAAIYLALVVLTSAAILDEPQDHTSRPSG